MPKRTFAQRPSTTQLLMARTARGGSRGNAEPARHAALRARLRVASRMVMFLTAERSGAAQQHFGAIDATLVTLGTSNRPLRTARLAQRGIWP